MVEEADYELVTDMDALERWIAVARGQGFVAIDTETTSLDAARAELVGVAMATSPGKGCYIPLRHVPTRLAGSDTPQQGLDFSAPKPPSQIKQIPYDTAIEALRGLLADEAVLKIGHNLKYDMHILGQPRNGGLPVYPVDDTMCLSYVLDAGRTERHGLDHLALNLLQVQTIKYEDLCGKGAKQISFAEVPPEAACAYASEDADICLRLWMMYRPRLAREGVSSVYERLERPLIPILAEMEKTVLWSMTISCGGCQMILLPVLSNWKRLSMNRQAAILILPLPNSWAKFCLIKWGWKGVKNRRQVPGLPGQMCWKIWPPMAWQSPSRF